MPPDRGRPLSYLTIAGSSLLLFLIQPMMTKAILPSFGGAAGVWVSAMMFFQVVLLLGYLYAYVLTRFSRGIQRVVHVTLLLTSLAILPIRPHLALANGENPARSILLVLATSIGFSFFLVSSTSPLLQAWYTGSFPWRLFAVSNAASLLALLAYPVLLEPLFTASKLLSGWSAAYAGVAVLACITTLLAPSEVPAAQPSSEGLQANRPLLWISLAMCASTLWLSVANHLSQEVAPVPFLWVLPLAIYLISFILCFEGRSWYRPQWFRVLLPAAWFGAVYSIARQAGLRMELAVFCAALFILCMFCHGELARTKPQARRDLPLFYLMLALGGALGGIFVGVVAPLVFSTYLELPLGIIASVFFALPLLYGMTSRARLLRLAVVSAAAFVIAARFEAGAGDVAHLRNFYGALQVTDTNATRSLYNGKTLHGVEFLDPQERKQPTGYYGPESGAGKVLQGPGINRRVAIVGLGAGTLAAYGRAGDSFRFYEINPAVIGIASQYFHFLAGSEAHTEIIAADGRLALEREPPGGFDVIVLDAFSDDSIPLHLVTREAFALYFRLLRPDGVLAIHLTNRYLDLEPVVDALAASFHRNAVPVHSAAEPARQILSADWTIIAGSSNSTGPVRRVWTDDYSNLFEVLR